MRRTMKALFCATSIFGGIALGQPSPDWTFEVLDTQGRENLKVLKAPVISCRNEVAFLAERGSDRVIYRVRNGQWTEVHRHSSSPRGYSDLVINDAGTIGFTFDPAGKNAATGDLIIADDEGTRTVLQSGGGQIHALAINNVGQIAMLGERKTGEIKESGVHLLDGQRSRLVAGSAFSSDGIREDFYTASIGVDLDDSGNIVFGARDRYGVAELYQYSGGALENLIYQNDVLDSLYDPLISNSGHVVANVRKRSGESSSPSDWHILENGQAKKIGEKQTRILGLSMNDHGAVAYSQLWNLFYAAHPELDATILLSSGDRLHDREVGAIYLSRDSVSNNGQLAFMATFVGGGEAVVVATPKSISGAGTGCSSVVQAVYANADNIARSSEVAFADGRAYPARVDGDPFSQVLPAAGESDWLLRESQRYRELLQSRDYDALVVPFFGAGDTLDAPGRTLLARVLAEKLESTGEFRVADPGLVEKALGAPARFVPDQKVFELARALGVSRLIVGEVSHDRAYTMTVKLSVTSSETGDFRGRGASRKEFDPVNLRFSDVDLPHSVFADTAAKWAEQIAGVKPREARKVKNSLQKAEQLPSSIEELVSLSKSSALEEARQLVFLGVLYPWTIDSRSRDHAFERALLALDRSQHRSREYRLLKAIALTNLNRRPAALDALGRPQSPAEEAMHAYLMGDLPRLESAVGQIDDAVFGLIALLQRQSLRYAFDRPAGREDVVSLLENYPVWGPLIAQRYLDGDPWASGEQALTKVAADMLLPGISPTIQQVVAGIMPVSQADGNYRIADATERHTLNALQLYGEEALAEQARREGYGPNVIDVIELIRDTTLAQAINEIRADRDWRNQIDAAVDLQNRYGSIYASNPQFAMQEGITYRSGFFSRNQRHPGGSYGAEKGLELNAKAYIWNPVQSLNSIKIAHLVDDAFPMLKVMNQREKEQALYLYDFPSVYYWRWDNLRKEADPRGYAEQCLRYMIDQVGCMLYSLNATKEPNERKTLAQMYKDELETRFIGSPERLEVMKEVRKALDPDFTDFDAYREAIEAGSADWEPYFEVGNGLLKSGDYEAALGAFIQFPGFHDSGSVGSAALSNQSYESGSNLYWAGAWEQAEPLYRIAAGLDTGSSASLASESRLALLESDWAGAMEPTLRRAKRFNSVYAYRDYIALLHFTGNHESAWTMFNQKLWDPGGVQLWTGAYLGHRMQAASHEEIVEWAASPSRGYKANLQKNSGVPMAMRYIVLTSVVDRKVPLTLHKTIRKLYPDASWEPTIIPAELLLPEDEFPLPDPYEGFRRLAQSAEALVALSKEQYGEAYSLLDGMGPPGYLQEFMPHYALAALRTGNTENLERYLEASSQRYSRISSWSELRDIQFHDNLATALVAGFQKRFEESHEYLNAALNFRPFTLNRSIFTYYQLLEVAEWLYEETQEEVYREFIADKARRFQKIQPIYPWAYAFSARWAPTREERIRAAAATLLLDPGSWRLSLMPASERKEADKWIESNGDPFAPAQGSAEVADISARNHSSWRNTAVGSRY